MTEQLISFETAKLAKEKGFLEPCLDIYDIAANRIFKDENLFNGWKSSYNSNNDILIPTQSLLQKWLREKYNFTIVIMTSINTNGKFEVSIEEIVKPFGTDMTDSVYCKDIEYNTYEEALEQGLIEALKLI